MCSRKNIAHYVAISDIPSSHLEERLFSQVILDNLNKDSPKERFKIPVMNSGFSIF
jgi:hypothetical protein